jgi:hypothetical protein
LILLLGIGAGLLLGLLLGGSFRQLGQSKMRFEGILVAVLALHVVWPVVAVRLSLGENEFLIVWLSSAVLLVGLALVNVRYAGMALVALGLLLNIVVVGANAGMPVALEVVGAAESQEAHASLAESPLHVPADAETRLGFLGDIVAVPLPQSMGGLISAGDLLLAAGAGVVVFQMMRRDSSAAGSSEAANA